MLLLFALACSSTDTGKADDGPVYAQPYLAFVLPVSPGYLKSTCEIALNVQDATTGETVYEVSLGATGREWIGTRIEASTLYNATASWSACNNYDTGTGSYPSTSAFSGEMGDLFVFYYNGVQAAFDTLHQETDYYGGQADVEVAEGADGAALASAAGVTGTAGDEADHWTFTWDDDTPVGEVLTLTTLADDYVKGDPLWVRDAPSWW